MRNMLAYGVSLFFIFLLYKKINIATFKIDLSNVNYFYFFLSIIVQTIAFVFQAVWWKHLLKNIANFPIVQTFQSLLMGHFFNAILPSRLGELARPLHLSKKHGQKFATIFGTCVIERIFDGFSVILLLIVSLVLLGAGSVELVQAGAIGGAVYLSGLIFVWLVLKRTTLIFSIFQKLGFGKITEMITDKIDELKSGFELIKNKNHFFNIILWTIILWTTNVYANYILLKSFELPPELITTYSAILMTAAVGLAYTLPSAPSSIGVYNYAIILVLELVARKSGIDLNPELKNSIVMASFVIWIASIIPDLVIGLTIIYKDRKTIPLGEYLNFKGGDKIDE